MLINCLILGHLLYCTNLSQKCLSNKLQVVIKELLSPNQCAFLKGKKMIALFQLMS